MESEKRKRGDDGEVDGKREKGGDDIINGRESTVTEEDEEVEEFYAILRRIQVAVKYFEEVGNCGGRKMTASSEWRPSFLLQDFEGENDNVVKSEGKVENLEHNSGLDLNSEPVSKEEH